MNWIGLGQDQLINIVNGTGFLCK